MKTVFAILMTLLLLGCGSTPKKPEIVYETRIEAVTLNSSYFVVPVTPLPPEKQEMIEAKNDRARLGLMTAYTQELLIYIKALKAQLLYIQEAELKAKQTLEKDNK